jgi:hypothetical protein
MTCRAELSRSVGNRRTCSKNASKDGYCTYHYNRMIANRPPPVAPPPTKPRYKSNTKSSGPKFSCLICCNDNIPCERNVDLKCGDAICLDCFRQLSDVKCPFCRRDMESEKISIGDIKKLKENAVEFRLEMEERTTQHFMEDGIRNNFNMGVDEFMDFFMELLNDDDRYAPEEGTTEDTEAMNIVITAMLADGPLHHSRNLRADEIYEVCNMFFPMYTHLYIIQLCNRCYSMNIFS